jgi:hypothetical protein
MTNLSTQSGRANSFVVTPPDFGLALAQCRPVGGRFLLQLFLLFEVRDTIRVRRRVIQHCNSTPRPNAISVCADLASEEQRRGPRHDGRRSDRFDRGVVLEIASGARLLPQVGRKLAVGNFLKKRRAFFKKFENGLV